MEARIARTAAAMIRQCRQAGSALAAPEGVEGWPAAAPDAAAMQAHVQDLEQQQAVVTGLLAQLRTAREKLRRQLAAAQADMRRIDRATDLLYGPDGAQKSRFGLEPRRKGRSARGVPEQVVIEAIGEGVVPRSIAIDWEAIPGSAYEVQWAVDSALQPVGSMVVTASEAQVEELTAGQQYYFRVRAIRGGRTGPWSDPATRMAGR